MKTPMTNETKGSTFEYACLLVAFFSIAACSASAVEEVKLDPNEILTFEFPDLPETYWSQVQKEPRRKKPAMLTAQLPENYSRDGKFPLFLWVGGGTGGPGDNVPFIRKLPGPRDYISVNLPLFIKDRRSIEPNVETLLKDMGMVEPGIHSGMITFDDFEVLSAAYRVMLQKLLDAVPNISLEGSTICGSSNGAHAVSALLAGTDEFIMSHFECFVIWEGGLALMTNPVEDASALRNHRFLVLTGDQAGGGAPPKRKPWFEALVQGYKEQGIDCTLVVLAGYGHGLPMEECRGLVDNWMRGKPLPAIPPKSVNAIQDENRIPPANIGALPGAEIAPSGLDVHKSLTNGEVLTIRQTWPQEPNGFDRTADVLVPSGQGIFPVVILLHGAGGNSSFIHILDSCLDNVIRVAPNGYRRSWNLGREPSKAPDVAFIRDLISRLKSCNNVDAGNISIFGASNGSALINRLLIELDGAAFQKAVCAIGQMTTDMYHDGSFWHSATGKDNYDQKIMPAPGRRIMSINGTADSVVPYLGGKGAMGHTFLDSQESLYRFAQAMGEKGPQIADANGIPGNLKDSDPTNDHSPEFVRYSYLKGAVIHYKLIGGKHSLGPNPSLRVEARAIIADFLLK